MKTRHLLAGMCLALLTATDVLAQGINITMKDGRVITAKNLRRQGDTIMATDPAEQGKAATRGEIGYPLNQIHRLEFPRPGVLAQAPEAIIRGKAVEALAAIDSALRYYEGFRDAPGSWWADLALLKVNALMALGREREAEPLAESVANMASDPEVVRGARVHLARGLMRKGDYENAVKAFDSVLKEAKREDTLAAAAINKGHSHLALKQPEPALLAYLEIPVFYPEQRVLVPAAQLGAGKAYFGLLDVERAKTTLKDLIAKYPTTPDAKAAEEELQKIARYEKALQAPGSESTPAEEPEKEGTPKSEPGVEGDAKKNSEKNDSPAKDASKAPADGASNTKPSPSEPDSK